MASSRQRDSSRRPLYTSFHRNWRMWQSSSACMAFGWKRPGTFLVAQARIKEIQRSERAFQGHTETRLTVTRERGDIPLPAGSFVVPMRQPLAALAFYLLEPESDDGVVNWN